MSDPSGAPAPEAQREGEDGRPPLAVAIVCRNNEATIGRTLDSVKGLARQIVAVDSGSTDGTIGLLESHGAEVTRASWEGHVKTKQRALDLCREDWILSLDSDESVEPALASSIRAAIRRDEAPVAGYEVNRKVWWRGAFLQHAWQPEWRLRLVRRGCAHWAGYDPHDKMMVLHGVGPSRVEKLRGDLRHDSFRTMSEFLQSQLAHARIAAESYVDLGRSPSVWGLVTSPVSAWLKQMVFRQAWRDGWRGWSAASATAAGALMKRLIFIERAHEERAKARGKGRTP